MKNLKRITFKTADNHQDVLTRKVQGIVYDFSNNPRLSVNGYKGEQMLVEQWQIIKEH